MSPQALALVLLAAILHATWNVAARRAGVDGGHFVFIYTVVAAAIFLPLSGLWLLVLPQPATWAWVWAPGVAGLLHALYGVVLQRGYRRGDLSLVYPVARGIGPLLTLIVAVSVLSERPDALAGVGALLVLAGIGVISLPGRDTQREHPVRVGVGWGAATGIAIAGYTLWDNHSVNALDVPPLPYFSIGLLFTALALAPRTWRTRDRLGTAWHTAHTEALTVGALSPLAYILVLEAMRLAPVGLVASTRESSIVLGVLLGRLLFREPGGVRRTLGSVVVLAGIALVALG